MKKQFIITISREYGSGGHEIGNILANALNIEMYDRALIREIAQEMDMDVEELKQYDEKPKRRVISRSVGEHSNSMEEILNEKQVAWIKRKAATGESFIVVGRRAKEILEGTPGLISIFITADEDYKVKRIMDEFDLNEEEAKAQRVRVDRHRKAFHNRYSEYKWGDSRCYDFIINSSRLGSLGTAMELLHYINTRVRLMEGTESMEDIVRELNCLSCISDKMTGAGASEDAGEAAEDTVDAAISESISDAAAQG